MKNEKKLIHTRNISCRGYRLSDNLYEIEGLLTDTKPFQTSSFDRNKIEPNEPIHEMVIRIKIDINFVIVDAESISKKTPYLNCGDVNKDFKKLIGLQIKTGFTQNVKNLIGGKVGCTHLVEMMRSIATTAFQALYLDRDKLNLNSNDLNRPKLLNSCYSWSESSKMIQKKFPNFYKKNV